jgi:hypothetical protein
MAIVANLGIPGQPIDPNYCSFNRSNAGEPNGVLTPQYVDEMVLDTTGNILWKALSLANNSWVALTSAN